MKLSAPKKIVFIIALVAAIIALVWGLGIFTLNIPVLTPFWLMTASFVLLMLGNLLKGF